MLTIKLGRRSIQPNRQIRAIQRSITELHFQYDITSDEPRPISDDLVYTSYYINVNGENESYKLHVMRISGLRYQSCNYLKPPCLLVHGAIENGAIFYSKNGKGFGPFLARDGFDVYIPDLRGHGLSTPSIRDDKKLATYGQSFAINTELPMLSDAISRISKLPRQIWITHSWGGVLTTSAMVRHPHLMSAVVCQVHFGTKRRITATNSIEYLKSIRFGWSFFLPILANYYGYLPSKSLKFGSDDDTKKYLSDTNIWLQKNARWVDTDDGFDYKAASDAISFENIPPTWHIAAHRDTVLGNKVDVKLWAQECQQSHRFSVLSVANGNREDYNHISMLASKSCEKDHFPAVAEWLNQNCQAKKD